MRELLESGFVVLPDFLAADRLAQLARAYDAAVADAAPADLRVGSTTTRVRGLEHHPEFAELATSPPILEACTHVIGNAFRLSSILARTVRPGVEAQTLHADITRDENEWPMLGFIVMVDDFRADNGATRFVPGSHTRAGEVVDASEPEVLACGPAGSVILYNGSVWHGHSANRTAEARRSIQGAYVRVGTFL